MSPGEQQARRAVGPEHGRPVEAGLTRDPAKATLFGADPWFRDGWGDLVRVGGERAVRLAHDHALVLLKPDAVVRRSLQPSLDWLQQQGAEPIGARRLTLDRGHLRTMWHYQLGASTRDRRDLGDLIITAGDSLLVVVRLPDHPVPATVRISAAKGPADPARRKPGDLRARLRGGNFLLNQVHAADEPADLARELAILLEPGPREAVLGRIAAGRADQWSHVRELATELEASAPAHDLALPTALAGLHLALGAAHPAARGQGAVRAAERAAAALDALRLPNAQGGASEVAWRALLDDLTLAGASVDRWDAIVLGTSLMAPSHPDVEPVLGSAARSWWPEVAR